MPIYVAASGPLAAKLAGRIGEGFICTSGKDPALYEELLGKVAEGAAEAGRDPAAIRRMIEIKVSYDRELERAFSNTHFWAALGLEPEQKEGIEDPLEMERVAQREPRPGAAPLHLLGRSRGGRGPDPRVHASSASTSCSLTAPATTSAASCRSSGRTCCRCFGIGAP